MLKWYHKALYKMTLKPGGTVVLVWMDNLHCTTIYKHACCPWLMDDSQGNYV